MAVKIARHLFLLYSSIYIFFNVNLILRKLVKTLTPSNLMKIGTLGFSGILNTNLVLVL